MVTHKNSKRNKSIERDIDELINNNREEYINRLTDLGGLETLGIGKASKMFPRLTSFKIIQKSEKEEDKENDLKTNINESLRFSLLEMYREVIWAYIKSLDRLSMLGCRAVVERALRIAYYEKTGNLAIKSWSLGPLLRNCQKVGISDKIIKLSRSIKNEGDNLAHAKWEVERHWNGIEMRLDPKNPEGPPVAYYATGDAKKSILTTRDLLKIVFGARYNETSTKTIEHNKEVK